MRQPHATIRRYLTILQSIMTMGWKQEYINSNPADTRRLEISKIVTPEVEAFSNEEIAEILKMAQLEPIHIHAVIATAIYTGARRGEIAGLKWEDIDFEKRTMYIRRSVVKLAQQEPEIKLPKTISSIRQIAIPQALCDILQELKKEQDRKKALLGEKWHEEGFLFTDWCGHVMHPHTPTKQFDKFLKKYGFRHLKFHGLRHSSATYLLSNGCDIKTVSKRLGHTSIDTTNTDFIIRHNVLGISSLYFLQRTSNSTQFRHSCRFQFKQTRQFLKQNSDGKAHLGTAYFVRHVAVFNQQS